MRVALQANPSQFVLGRTSLAPYQKGLIELIVPEKLMIDLATDPEPVLELMEAAGRRLNESSALAPDSRGDASWQPDDITSDRRAPNTYGEFNRPF